MEDKMNLYIGDKTIAIGCAEVTLSTTDENGNRFNDIPPHSLSFTISDPNDIYYELFVPKSFKEAIKKCINKAFGFSEYLPEPSFKNQYVDGFPLMPEYKYP